MNVTSVPWNKLSKFYQAIYSRRVSYMYLESDVKVITTFGNVSYGRENNFDFLRFFFAALVIFAHSYAFVYTDIRQHDPLVRFSNGQIGMGSIAVDSFFLISGFLITRSWLYSKGAIDYVVKRALRILPALVVVLLFCIFIIGPLGTTLPFSIYFRNAGTYRYFGFMLHPSLHVYDKLPGLFMSNPLAGRVNGSLWTIRQEIVCYAFVVLMGLVRIYRRPMILLTLLVVPYLLDVRGSSVLGTGGIHDFFHLLTYFMLGMLFYLYRDHIPYSRRLLLVSLAVIVVFGFVLGRLPLVLPFCGAYLLFYVAFNKNIKLQHFARHGDFSYGIYLYAFPVQQLLVVHFRNVLSATTLSLTALTICTGLAALSWHVVEQPFLKLKSKSRIAKVDAITNVQQSVSSEEPKF